VDLFKTMELLYMLGRGSAPNTDPTPIV